ncbi:glucose dehydrogenase [FAD, quinone]-like [Mya arenaria]|uniref:glucose dehydrogenase [FAD, quinone]-like n=1 Tax=Mya arenaria TaxID=6604 RepID=UPI0022E0A363|nr:glucose dehydrogenase [FAD, quinone]-like [Mya arenaria]
MELKIAICGIVAAFAYFYFLSVNPFKSHREILTDTVAEEYDYIVVGGGSAGSVLAARLSEDKGNRVLLLEAGGFYDENPWFHIPIRWLDIEQTEHDWAYYTEPQKDSCLGLKENKAFWPRGRVLGGSSVFNAMQYTRGSRYEYDQWAKNGIEGWSYKDVLPYFLKSENIQIDELLTSPYHHSGGPLTVSSGRVTELSDLYMKAGQELGYNITDYNGVDQEGFNRIQLTVKRGVRDNTGLAFLGRSGKRLNLDIALHSFVTKIDIQNKRGVGVYFIRNGRKQYVRARKEIILSGGAINSPQILMLSGVGPKEHLEYLKIPVVADLPVGNNLDDHLMIFLFSKINQPYSITKKLKESWSTLIKYYLFGTGPLTIAGSDGSGFFYIDEKKRGKTNADIQAILFSDFLDKGNARYFNFRDEIADEYLAENPDVEGFNAIFSVTHPKSKGTIRLRSTDPFDYPILDPRYLEDKQDIEAFIGGIRIWEKFIQTPTMKKLGADIEQMKLSFCSHHDFRSDAYWECFVRHVAVTVYHHSCTCKMGAIDDKTSVLDPQLKVKGIQGLRVVDASSLPQVTSGNTNAPVIMMAEKTADLIRGIDSVTDIRKKLPKDI